MTETRTRKPRVGRTTEIHLELSLIDRTLLEACQRSTTMPAGMSRRARILLLLVEGQTITAIANAVGMSRRHVYKWVARWIAGGLEGLKDLPRDRHRRSLGGAA